MTPILQKLNVYNSADEQNIVQNMLLIGDRIELYKSGRAKTSKLWRLLDEFRSVDIQHLDDVRDDIQKWRDLDAPKVLKDWYWSIIKSHYHHIAIAYSPKHAEKLKKKTGQTDSTAIAMDYYCWKRDDRVCIDIEHGISMISAHSPKRLEQMQFFSQRNVPVSARGLLVELNETLMQLGELAPIDILTGKPYKEFSDKGVSDGVCYVQFSDGWSWHLIASGESEMEAMAMRHCGNLIKQKGDIMFSLREPTIEGKWRPHLTFILDKNGVLCESKGFANKKPQQKYHTYIVALLLCECVKAVASDRYLRDNDFVIGDLSVRHLAYLYDSKPSLLGSHETQLISNQDIAPEAPHAHSVMDVDCSLLGGRR